MNLPDNVEVSCQNEWWTFLARTDVPFSVSVPTDEQEVGRVAKLLSELDPDMNKRAYPVYGDSRNVVGCLT